ncbi:MAG: hypothetical protein M3511_00685 [Deinococcota bacterium]|nr:hypothetical protein [Deinococcota bacterium]
MHDVRAKNVRVKSFAAKLGADDDGSEAWTLVLPESDVLVIQHALMLGPGVRRAEVRALRLHRGRQGPRWELSRLEVGQAVVDSVSARALWGESSLSLSEAYGATAGWRWRLRAAAGAGPAVSAPLGAFADAHISFPITAAATAGELRVAGGWRPLRGHASLVHRFSRESSRAWAWLALPGLEGGGSLVASVVALPSLPLVAVTGWWRWKGQEQAWPSGVAMFLRRFSRSEEGWSLTATVAGRRLRLTLREVAVINLERSPSGRVKLAYVEAELDLSGEKVRGRGVLEYVASDEPV